jgi:hypothetical protein
MRNFKELKTWQKGFQIAVQGFRITETFPQQEKFGLALQINKAGVSIPSNIAEGAAGKVIRTIAVSWKFHWVRHLKWKPSY